MKKLVKENLNEIIGARVEVSDCAITYWLVINDIKDYCNDIIKNKEGFNDEMSKKTATFICEDILKIIKNM